MFLENLGVDAMDPLRLGRFWEAALGTTSLTVEPDILETRLDLDGTAYLDLCFVRVPAPNRAPLRLQLALRGGAQRAAVVERLRGLGAEDLDSGHGAQPWSQLRDVEGRAFRVSDEEETCTDTGPLAAVLLDSAAPERDAEFWAWLSGWAPASGVRAHALRHPSLQGPLLELVPEHEPKRPAAKNPLHLDVRLEPGDDPEEIAAEIERRGGREMHPDWGELPWRVHQDPSGNEFCVLPAPAVAP